MPKTSIFPSTFHLTVDYQTKEPALTSKKIRSLEDAVVEGGNNPRWMTRSPAIDLIATHGTNPFTPSTYYSSVFDIVSLVGFGDRLCSTYSFVTRVGFRQKLGNPKGKSKRSAQTKQVNQSINTQSPCLVY